MDKGDTRSPEGERLMQTVGFIALIVVAVFVVLGLALVVAAIPDVRRYMRIRHM
jgi:hypothetical protein